MNDSKDQIDKESTRTILTDKRRAKFEEVVSKSQFDLSVLLENVHDPHNIGAVIRSCDAIGVREIYVLYTDPRNSNANLEAGKNSSSGARKWIKTRYYDDLDTCITDVRAKYSRILGTHLSDQSGNLYEMDLTQSAVLVFGNEHAGISEDLLKHLDASFLIPQFGMVQSLNISVSCAVCLYEAMRQRSKLGSYQKVYDPNNSSQRQLMEQFIDNHLRIKNRKTNRG